MRTMWSVGQACALAALPAVVLTALLTGCQKVSAGPAAQDGRPGGTPTASRSSGYGAVFLAVDECSSFGTTGFAEVPCSGERAAARVIARHDGAVRDGPPCPPSTDFVLHIGAQRRSSGEDGDGDGNGNGNGNGAIPQGYACMRNLEPPHPGDPGAGGGPRTVVGDCVYGAGRGEVRETACDGSGKRKPEYRVTRAVRGRSQCPASTALYVRVDGERPVGCARRL
ncbi:hypothetical protein ABZT08_26220 [Streptomyces sp. NPDC005526]|uniref:hypothetical protein n=1 Tax=Streptomyces sp. NPDC005526 TaxID=3156885 RepID=UPI0033A0FAFB